ncbi:hypothetical protein GCM10010495_31990 [Kitasatospora herbaricolor]|nr:hypothetical protein GCM10010495_31990 [Kitasatospora herbaricolor]
MDGRLPPSTTGPAARPGGGQTKYVVGICDFWLNPENRARRGFAGKRDPRALPPGSGNRSEDSWGSTPMPSTAPTAPATGPGSVPPADSGWSASLATTRTRRPAPARVSG